MPELILTDHTRKKDLINQHFFHIYLFVGMHLYVCFKTKQTRLVLCLAVFRSGWISFLSGNLVKMYIMGRLPSQKNRKLGEFFVLLGPSADLHIDQGAWCSIIAFCLGIRFALFIHLELPPAQRCC